METRLEESGVPPLARWPLLVAAALGGFLLGIFGTYWDDAWHTEEGRDTFFIAPHLVLYAGISLAGGALTLWTLLAIREVGWRRVIAYPPLATALLGVGLTFLAAPADNAWHVAFGRDAVLWSPPHMLGVIGSLAIAGGLLLELGSSARPRWARASGLMAAAAVLAVCVIPVLEFETDVPQFDLVFYLPVLATGAAFALGLGRLAVLGAWPATTTALVYSALMGSLLLVLTVAGMPGPLLPLLVAPALVLDLSDRRLPLAAAALSFATALYLVYVPYLNWAKSGVYLDSADVLLGLPLAVLGSAVALWLTAPRAPGRRGLVAAVGLAVLLVPAAAGLGHDPGQGEELGTARVRASVAQGSALLEVRPNRKELCPALEPVAVVGRRAGEEIRAPLETAAPCQFQGQLELPERGRWFVYAELSSDGRAVETWLPVHTESAEPVADRARSLYLPPSAEDTPLKLASGILIYGVFAAALLALPVLFRRRQLS